MIKNYLSILILLLSFNGLAQLQNVNPDPNGAPWMLGGYRVLTKAEISKIPEFKLSTVQKNSLTQLPTQLDNTQNPYFRSIFNQTDGCCSQASGIAYNFTYELNRERGTAANVPNRQFPTHYTYNFLNGGSGDNGSNYTDGWDIIKADGCPTVMEYGGIANGGASRWMSGYIDYESGMHNRIKDYFYIDVSTPAGLETLKHWMFDHGENASDGSIVNFAAGISNLGYNKVGDIVVSWGFSVNHAMTFVGWDDAITYDYNNDGQITNDMDTNNDGVVDMKDWERGALIMVNSWGTSWGNGGKAYVMYRTLAESTFYGGISGKKVFGIHVKSMQTPQLIYKLNMLHNKRNRIKISVGVSQDVNASTPEHIIDYPLFNYQGGEFNMRGTSSSSIEISLDASPLLSYIDNNVPSKFFLIITEKDPSSTADGQIFDFAIKDNAGNEFVCAQHHVQINNNTDTVLAISNAINFDAPTISTNSLPIATGNTPYTHQMQATGGETDYIWHLKKIYHEQNNTNNYPQVTGSALTTNSDDDGYATQLLDFDFPYYGQTYQQLNISTDGSIIFENEFSYIRTEGAIKGNKALSVYANDLMIYPADGDGIFYEGDATHATFRWKTSLYGDQNANFDFAVTLYPNGEIKFFYGNGFTTGQNWAAGISDGEGSYEILPISNTDDPSNQKYGLLPESFPIGMSITPDGIFQGTTPNEANTWTIHFVVTDNNNISKEKPIDFTATLTSIATEKQLSAVCFPNPVTSTASFNFELKNPSTVSLKIYDYAGKCVDQINLKKQNKGKHQIHWTPKVSKGIYFYKLMTNSSSYGDKIIIE